MMNGLMKEGWPGNHSMLQLCISLMKACLERSKLVTQKNKFRKGDGLVDCFIG